MLETLSAIWKELGGKDKRTFALLTCSRIIIHGLDLVALAGLAVLSSALVTQQESIEIPGFGVLIPLTSSAEILVFFATVLFIFLLKSGFGASLLKLTTGFLADLDARQAKKISNYLFSGTLLTIGRFSKGDITWKVLRSSQSAFGVMLFSAASLATESALFVAIVVFLVIIDPIVTGFLAVYFVGVALIFTQLVGERTRRLGSRFREHSTHGQELLHSLVTTFRELTVSGRRGLLLDDLAGFRTQQSQDWALQRFYMALPRFVVEIALIGAVLFLAAIQVFVLGSSNFAELGIFVLGGLRLMAALLPIQNAVTELRVYAPQASGALSVLAEARGENTEDLQMSHCPSNDGQNENPPEELAVEVRDLSFAYPGRADYTLKNLSLTIPAKELHAIVGPSGAGKSTLVDCLIGLLEPRSGSVLIDGHTARLLMEQYPGMIQYVPQYPGFLPGSIATNVTLKLRPDPEDSERLHKALAQANLASFIRGLPNGVDTDLGEHHDSMSGGQLQRIALARALFHKPRLLVLDEYTSALDRRNEKLVTRSIVEMLDRTTVIVVSHRPETLSLAHQIHLLEGGKITQSGTLASLKKSSVDFRKYLSDTPSSE